MVCYLIGGTLIARDGLDAGQITVRQLITKALTCELTLNDDESIEAALQLPLIEPVTGAIVDVPSILLPGRDYIGVMEDRGDGEGPRLLAAGPIAADPYTFPSTSKIVATGMWGYFDQRYVLPVLDGRMPSNVTSKWSGLSLHTIAKRLVQQALSHPGAELPIDFEDDVPGEHTREFPGADLVVVGEALRNLTSVQDGIDIAFRPYITDTGRHVRWKLVTGQPFRQDGAPHYWDTTVPTPHATIPELDRDARDLHQRMIVTGAEFDNLVPEAHVLDPSQYEAPAEGGTATVGESFWPDQVRAVRGYATMPVTGWLGVQTSQIAVEPGDVLTFTARFRSEVVGTRTLRSVVTWINENGETLGEALGLQVPQTKPNAATVVPDHRQDLTLTAPEGATGVMLQARDEGNVPTNEGLSAAFMVTRSDVPVPWTTSRVRLESVAEQEMVGFPLREAAESRPSVLRPDTVDAYAAEGAARGVEFVVTRKLAARRDQHPTLGTYLPGDIARVVHKKTAREPRGTTTERIVALSFGATGDVTVTLAPERQAAGYTVPPSDRAWLADKLRTLDARVAEQGRR